MKWLQRLLIALGLKKEVHDSVDVIKHHYPHHRHRMFVNHRGKLIYQDYSNAQNVQSIEVTGICEWSVESKINHNVNAKATVLDLSST